MPKNRVRPGLICGCGIRNRLLAIESVQLLLAALSTDLPQSIHSVAAMATAEFRKISTPARRSMKKGLFPAALVPEGCPPPPQDVYEICPRNDRDGFDLISDRFQRGPIWYAGPDAVRNAVSFANYCSRSRSRWAIIRVFDEAGNVTEAHEQ